jgi:hypothetical protein
MKAKELKKLFENIDDEVDIIPYILDFEYFDDFPEDLGKGIFLDLEDGCENMYLNIGIHK